MAKTPKKSEPKIELRPDGWERFEKAVVRGAKSGPKHRAPQQHKKRAKPKK